MTKASARQLDTVRHAVSALPAVSKWVSVNPVTCQTALGTAAISAGRMRVETMAARSDESHQANSKSSDLAALKPVVCPSKKR